ncbi:hypothetical protein UY3_07347 [Chelonia mydas]|uniref:Uncharacterized protein n=1 Tax=Chelonia mydas TaxID=8469 RepID=M7BDZ6_CHEMY|nr:hypothetical protein UY3_07347 [Chelonia mydas]
MGWGRVAALLPLLLRCCWQWRCLQSWAREQPLLAGSPAPKAEQQQQRCRTQEYNCHQNKAFFNLSVSSAPISDYGIALKSTYEGSTLKTIQMTGKAGSTVAPILHRIVEFYKGQMFYKIAVRGPFAKSHGSGPYVTQHQAPLKGDQRVVKMHPSTERSPRLEKVFPWHFLGPSQN